MAYLIVKVAIVALLFSSALTQVLPNDGLGKYQQQSCCPQGYNAAGVYCVMPPSTGMLPTKDVLPVKLDTPGTKLPEFAHAANCQDKSSELNASAHHQKLNGTLFQRPAHAQ